MTLNEDIKMAIVEQSKNTMKGKSEETKSVIAELMKNIVKETDRIFCVFDNDGK